MTVFRLGNELIFPHPELADSNGLLAIGGDLSPRRILLAYCLGIFPWYERGSPILWWSPDPRLVLFPADIKIYRSLRRVIKKKIFSVSMDKDFSKVIRKCAEVRLSKGIDTWLTPEMIEAYERLHKIGYAHSVEVWQENEIVGGLYGVSIGKAFFGESMFSEVSDSSKIALVFLCRALLSWGYHFIDCQVTTEHLKRMGAKEIPRKEFLRLLNSAVIYRTRIGKWTEDFDRFYKEVTLL